MRQPRLRRFRGILFDCETGELHVEGRRLRLRAQSARVLAFLVDRPGEAVAREALRAAVWPDAPYGADKGLNACVRDIRHALGDDPGSPTFIETIPKYGYRFLPAVGRSGTFGPARRWGLAAAVGLLALAGWGLWPDPGTNGGAPTAAFVGSLRAAQTFRQARALTGQPGYAPLFRARNLLEKVLQEVPNSGLAHTEAAYVDFLLEDYGGARVHVERALALEPLSARAYATRAAIALYWDGDASAARHSIALAESLAPTDPHVLVAAGFVAAATGDRPSARAYAHRLGAADASAAVRMQLGYLHYVLGQYGEMERACEAALASTRRVTEPLRCRVLARLAQGDPAGAARFAAAVLGLAPDSFDAETTLEQFWTRELEAARRTRRGPRGAAHVQAARALAVFGRTQAAVAELLRAEAERPVWLAYADQLPAFQPLRRHPQFENLRARLYHVAANE